ncbi:MAG: EamA family transporter RarD [Alphaproteobacteria bacterium]
MTGAAGEGEAAAAPQEAHETRGAQAAELRLGLISAFGAFGLWGVNPVYWKFLTHVPAFEIIAQRIVWGMLTFAAILFFQSRLRAAFLLLRTPKIRRALLASTVLIAVNWLVFIWAVTSGRVLEASLGYYINPLLSVALGALVLGERLNRIQMSSVVLAALGVLILATGLDGFPWVSLTLAGCFAAYGLVRKVTPVPSADGLFIETLLCTPLALLYLYWLWETGAAVSAQADAATWALLIFAGPFTALPLMLFNMAARRVRLSTLGLVQYLAPSMHFVLAVAFFGEAFTPVHAVVFGLIWTGLALFSWDSRRQYRAQRRIEAERLSHPPSAERP